MRWDLLLKECISYGMMPSEFWQCSPFDVMKYIAVNRPPIMRGHLTKKRYDELFDKLDQAQEKERLQENG